MNLEESLVLNYKGGITMAIGKTKSYSKREFHRVLLDNGFELVRTRGSHYVFKRGNEEIVTNKDINKMVIRRLIKTYNLNF